MLHLLSQTILTGAESYAVELCEELQKAGHCAWICSDTIHLETKAKVLLKPVHDRSNWAKTLAELLDIIEKNGIHILHTHSRSSAKLARLICKQLPTLSHVHTFHGLQKHSLSKQLKNSFGESNIFVCENIQTAMDLQKIKYSNQFQIIRNGIHCKSTKPAEMKLEKAAGSRKKIALISRLSNLKGQRTLQVLQAAMEVFKKHPDIEFHLIAGDFDSLSKSDQLIITNYQNLFPEEFFFHGFIKNLSERIPDYDLIFAGGRIAAEALMNGIPVFAFGESHCHGLVHEDNYKDCLASNFGDILFNERPTPWQPEALKKQIEQSLKDQKKTVLPIHAEFDFQTNFNSVFKFYKQTLGRKLAKNYFPILMYHKIVHEEYQTPHKIYVLAKDFENHLKFYKSQGFTSIHFKDYKNFREGNRNPSEFPQKPMMITFDDGYLNNLEIALPLLEKYQMKATVFLLANNQISTNQWDASSEEKHFELMTPAHRLLFSKHPLIEIGSHGFSHRPLDEIQSAEDRFAELKNSKLSLEKELGINITAFAYTYGRRTSDASSLASKAGYEFAVNTDTGGLTIEDDPHSIFRISMFPKETNWTLWKKTHKIYRRYYKWKRKK
ncbi:MAG: polysaccharide deacetylase family protein [Pseudobdellovibrionaceae bacterium]